MMFFVRDQNGETVAITTRKEDALAFILSDESLFVEEKGSLVKVSVDTKDK
jgi:hypothetical protein